MAHSAPLQRHAAEYKAQLTGKILPYWLKAQDLTNGGFLLQDDLLKGPSTPREKQLVSQSRMVWTFSHAHLHGFDKDDACLKAAENGYRFLTEKFFDAENGGYFWKTDLRGKPTSDRKILYGEAFALYALVEYHRASKKPEPLQHAMDLYRVIQQRTHDPKHRGWAEHFTRDWKPLAPGDRSGEVEVVGLKSANAHLHLQEALAELYGVTRDADVKRSLEEALELNKKYFYPSDAGRSCFHRQPDWREVADPVSAGLSYGHNVEFAWLMLRAEEVLGRKKDWPHFYAHLNHALKFGYDHERGGLYHRGVGDEPATDKNKIWWVGAEMMAALTEAIKHEKSPEQERALDQLIHFLNEFQTGGGRNGIWMDTVTADGKPRSTALAHNWKANYHDVRALVKFIEAFE
jgi:mannose/cellobiose epimerase-like protein (N-acyl-D-glucosamine 2-epimerase family)